MTSITSFPSPLRDMYRPPKVSTVVARFGQTTDVFEAVSSTSPPLDYKHLETIKDPVLGEIQHYRFSDGMEFYGLAKKNIPLVTYGLLLKDTGSRNESSSTNGISHFLEHLIFKGTPNLKPGEADQKLEQLGLQLNAHTGYDWTLYPLYYTPRDKLGQALPIHSELLQNVHIPQEDLDKERHVVIEEIKRSNDNPSNRQWYSLAKQLWPGHPYSQTVLGPEENIKAFKRDDFLAYYGQQYGPKNRAVFAVGDFDTQSLLKDLSQQFNRPFPPSHATATTTIKPGDTHPSQGEPVTSTTELSMPSVKAPMLAYGWDGPVNNIKAETAMHLACLWLAGDKSSVLHQALVEKQAIVSEVKAEFGRLRDKSVLELYTPLTGNYSTADAQAQLTATMDQAFSEGLTPEAFRQLKLRYKSTLMESLETQRSLMMQLAYTIGNNQPWPGEVMKTLDNLTPEDVVNTARRYLSADRRKTVIVASGEKIPKVKPKGAMRFGGKLADNQSRSQLPGGQTLVLTHQPDNPRLAVSLTLPGQGNTKLDLAMLAEWLQRGVAQHSANRWQQKLSQDAVDVAISNNTDSLTLTVSGLAEKKPIILKRLHQLVTQAQLQADEMETVKQQTKAKIQTQLDSSPQSRLMNHMINALYPADHPYGSSLYRALSRLDDMSPDTLRQTWRRLMQAPDITLSAVGGITPADFSHTFNGLPKPVPTSKSAIPQPIPLTKNRTLTFTEPGLTQATVIRAWHAPRIADKKDVNAMRMLTGILSGGLSSRLFVNFREKENGLCYDVSANYTPMGEDGLFKLNIGTSPDKIPRVLEKFDEEIQTLLTTLPTEEELHRFRNGMTSRSFAQTESTSVLSIGTGEHVSLNRPSLQERVDALQHVTAEDVRRVAQKWLTRPSLTGILAPPSDKDTV